jgi:hypothetical protein
MKPSCFSLGYSLAPQYLSRDVKLQSPLSLFPTLANFQTKIVPWVQDGGVFTGSNGGKTPTFQVYTPTSACSFYYFCNATSRLYRCKGFSR